MRKQVQPITKVYAYPLNLKYRCEQFISGDISGMEFYIRRAYAFIFESNAISYIEHEYKYIKEKWKIQCYKSVYTLAISWNRKKLDLTSY
jgi:hypothetical protein